MSKVQQRTQLKQHLAELRKDNQTLDDYGAKRAWTDKEMITGKIGTGTRTAFGVSPDLDGDEKITGKVGTTPKNVAQTAAFGRRRHMSVEPFAEREAGLACRLATQVGIQGKFNKLRITAEKKDSAFGTFQNMMIFGDEGDRLVTPKIGAQTMDLRNSTITKKFLLTDMTGYLNEERPHANCISCAKCIATKAKVLQFKYSKGMRSTYDHNSDLLKSLKKKNLSPTRTKAWNIGDIRKEVKVPYDPPRNMSTIYGNTFAKEAHQTPEIRKAPKGHLDFDGVVSKMSPITSNKMTYVGHMRLPEANKKGRQMLTTGFGKFYGESSYGNNFADRQDEDYREKYRVEKARVKEFGQKFQRGSFSPKNALPFFGKK